MQNFTSRLMRSKDFEQVANWCIQENWDIGLYDRYLYSLLDTKGHFILENEEKRPISSISIIKHSELAFTLGPFIVDKMFRHKGYGQKIWQEGMNRMNNENSSAFIMLLAVNAQVKRYEKEGFATKFTNHRWILPQQKNLSEYECVPITTKILSDVALYDAQHFLFSRSTLINEVIKFPNVKSFVKVDKNQIVGFGIIRPCIRGYRIGPLVADSASIAEEIILSLVKDIQTEILIDIPSCNEEGAALMKKIGAIRRKNDDTKTMFKGKNLEKIKSKLEQYYAIFSLEIG